MFESVNEIEVDNINPHIGIGVFEQFVIYGGAGNNSYSLVDFTRSASFDGTEGSDTYVLTLSGDIDGMSSTVISDSGTGSIDFDSIEIRGGDDADTLHLDADKSLQDIERLDSGSFYLHYNDIDQNNPARVLILDTDGAAEIESKLKSLHTIGNGADAVSVTGNGTAADPWKIDLKDADRNAEQQLFPIYSSDNGDISLSTIARGRRFREQR